MSERGVYAIDRGIWDHPMFAPEPYTEREAWLWMLGQASWEPRTMRVGRAHFEVTRAQFAVAMRYLATKWKWSEPRVRRFLKRCSSDAMVLVQPTREATLITICNYDEYQFSRRADVPSIDAQTDVQATQNKEIKKTNIDNPPSATKTYAFESGAIRLNAADFEKWREAFSYLDLRAELIAAADWAGEQANWFHACKALLAKRNRDAKAKADALKAQGGFAWNGGIEGVV